MITHIGTVDVETERLLLRRYRLEDAEDIFKNYATDERVTKFLSWLPYDSLDSLKAFIGEQVSLYDDNVYNWVIEYENQVIGSISTLVVDEKNEFCELGYCIGFEFWNRVIVTEAMLGVLKFLFTKVGFHRVFAKHDADNPSSGKVMMKCKMVYEGRLRDHYLRHDKTFSDAMVYSVLKSEFELTMV